MGHHVHLRDVVTPRLQSQIIMLQHLLVQLSAQRAGTGPHIQNIVQYDETISTLTDVTYSACKARPGEEQEPIYHQRLCTARIQTL